MNNIAQYHDVQYNSLDSPVSRPIPNSFVNYYILNYFWFYNISHCRYWFIFGPKSEMFSTELPSLIEAFHTIFLHAALLWRMLFLGKHLHILIVRNQGMGDMTLGLRWDLLWPHHPKCEGISRPRKQEYGWRKLQRCSRNKACANVNHLSWGNKIFCQWLYRTNKWRT